MNPHKNDIIYGWDNGDGDEGEVEEYIDMTTYIDKWDETDNAMLVIKHESIKSDNSRWVVKHERNGVDNAMHACNVAQKCWKSECHAHNEAGNRILEEEIAELIDQMNKLQEE